MGSFIMGLNVNIVGLEIICQHKLFNLIKNLYVPLGILFDPKRYYKDGDCARMLRRPIRPRWKEIDDVGEESTIWKSGSVGVLKTQDGCSTHPFSYTQHGESTEQNMRGVSHSNSF
ncbi:hypothetical protein Tco_1157458 [Tanacetum coccineum]